MWDSDMVVNIFPSVNGQASVELVFTDFLYKSVLNSCQKAGLKFLCYWKIPAILVHISSSSDHCIQTSQGTERKIIP